MAMAMAINPYCKHGYRWTKCSACEKLKKIEVLEAEVERLKGVMRAAIEEINSGYEVAYGLCMLRDALEGNKRLQEEVERLKGVVYAVAVDAHMAGQFDAGVDPSFSNAQEYANKIATTNKG